MSGVCNKYIMRGCSCRPATTPLIRFRAPLAWLYVSMVAFATGALLVGYVIFTGRAPPEVVVALDEKSCQRTLK